ncbi:MAG: hypothetical protein JWP97_5749 [Labilithrix sp.]|nr:hypothetical protein [Labilithrix sp.]
MRKESVRAVAVPCCLDPDCKGPQTHGGKRRSLDDYPSPEWVILAIAPHVAGKVVLDPCCGAGAILDVFRALGAVVIGIEISEERAAEARAKGHNVICADALAIEWPDADLIISNPPFSHAQEFAEKALACVATGGTVALLLRLGFLESKKRIGFHRANGSSVYVLSSRPSFTGNGKTDASGYGWFLWGSRHARSLHFLDAVDPSRRARTIPPTGPETRPIPGAAGYLASSDGKILSTWRRARHGRAVTSTPDGEPKELAAYDRKSVKGEPTPYRSVMVKWDGGKRKPAYVHHLVALAFLGPRPDGAEVLHGAKGSSCNAAENLRYGTPDENGGERAIARGDDWYRARGLRPPRFDLQGAAEETVEPAAPPSGAFDDLLEAGE